MPTSRILIFIIGFLAPQLGVAQLSSRAQDIRATFIFHIANYMSLPQKAKNSQRLTFCFLENAPYTYYEHFAKLNIKELRGLTVQVRKISKWQEIPDSECQLVFFDRKHEKEDVFAMLKTLNTNVVTIGESRNFVDRGGIVGLVELQSRIKVFINRQEYSKSSIKFSSMLLKHAKFR